jgi:predicted amidohydrolase
LVLFGMLLAAGGRAFGENAVHIGFDADAPIGASSAAWDTFVFNRTYGDQPIDVQINGPAPGQGREGGAGHLKLRYGDDTPAGLTYWTMPFAEPVPIVPELQEIGFWVKTNVPVSIKVPIAPFGFIYHGPAVQPSDQWQKLSVGDAYERLKAWCAGGGEDADFGQLPGVILAVHSAPGMQAEILVDDVAVSGQAGIGAAVDQQRRRRRFARVTASVVTLPWSDPGRSLDTVLDRLDEAAACGSDIVCLPMECVKTDGQPIPGPISTAIAAKAREHGVYVIGNIRESEGDKIYVTSFLCGRDGELIGKYRKSHKMPDEDMDLGDDLPVFATDFGPVAMRIGSDRYFADIDHVYTAKGARMIFWSQEFEPLEDEVMQDFVSEGRAQDYNVFIACARYSFDGPGWITNFWPRYRGCPIGRSYIINREGQRIASTTRKGTVATAVIPRGELAGPGRGPNRNPAFRALTEPVHLPEPRAWAKRVVRVTAIENHVGIDDLIEKLDAAGRIGSDIVCTYEFVWIRGGPDEQVRKQTEQAHENLRRIREKAKQYGMYVLVGGVVDRLERNEAILVDREGNEAGRYFKIVATHPEQIPGQETPVLETDFGRIGIRICADNAHVEIDRSYGVKGVDILFDLTQDWGPDAIHRNLRNISRAMDAQMFRVEATHSSSEVLHRSHVVEPTGMIVAQSQYMSNGLVSAVIDLDHDRPRRFTRQWRTHEPGGYLPQYQFTEMPQMENDLKETILSQRRPELYQVLAVEE